MWLAQRTRLHTVLSILVLGILLLVPVVVAQETAPTGEFEPPPAAGAVIVDDPLTAPGVLGPPSACATGRNVRDFVGEGAILKVTGRCTEGNTSAGIAYLISRVTVPDGELKLEFKAVSGQERAELTVYARVRPTGLSDGNYAVVINPAQGVARLRVRQAAGGDPTILAERSDLAGLLRSNDWNTLTLSLQGSALWVTVNDQTIISARDTNLDSGVIAVGLSRTGPVDDPQETAAILRNLRVSALASGDQARLPTYQAPATAAAPATAGPPWIGDITFGYDQSGNGAVPAGATLPAVSAGTIYGFFSWRDVPAGTPINVRVLWGNEVRDQFDFSPRQPAGRTRVGIVSFDSSGGGGATWNMSNVGLAFSIGGMEVARGVAGLP